MTAPTGITAAEWLFASGNRLGRCELVRGKLAMTSPAEAQHGEITMQLAVKIALHVDAK